MRKVFSLSCFKKFNNKNAQSTVEQIFLFVLIASGLIIMLPYVKKAWNAGIKSIDDSVIDSHYDPLLQGTITDICSGGPVDGGWSGWGPCICKPINNASSEGRCTRTRTCTNPAPTCGGQDCQQTEEPPGSGILRGNSMELNCDLGCYPVVDGGWDWSPDAWTDWSICIGCQQFRTKILKDHCTDPRPSCGGKDCGPSPIEWRACGPVDGHYERIAGPCVNCVRTVTNHCTAQCGGGGCSGDTTVLEACSPPSGLCTPTNICASPTSYYSTHQCVNGACVSSDPVPCQGAVDTECMHYGASTCIEGAGGCVPDAATTYEIADGTECEVGTVYCSSDRLGWYDRKTCLSGTCTGPGPTSSYVECPLGVTIPGDVCNEIPHSKCNMALVSNDPIYCTEEDYVGVSGICGSTDFCRDIYSYYEDQTCGPNPAGPNPYACNSGINVVECHPTQAEVALLNISTLDCIASIAPSTCEDFYSSGPLVGQPRGDGNLCIDTMSLATYEAMYHVCSDGAVCDDDDPCILHDHLECDDNGNCVLFDDFLDQNCCGDEEEDALYCKTTSGICLVRDNDPDVCDSDVVSDCAIGEVCVPDDCNDDQYDNDQCTSAGYIWIQD